MQTYNTENQEKKWQDIFEEAMNDFGLREELRCFLVLPRILLLC